MSIIVIGSLNTDLVATGLQRFPEPGQHVYGKELIIGPGGKSRNIADMIAHLTSGNDVAMVGRTVSDPYGLWKAPLDALVKSGVNIDYVNVVNFDETKKLPGIALIPVDQNGNNQIIVLPGVSDDFNNEDIDSAKELFERSSENDGALVLTLECPTKTAEHAVKVANRLGIKVMFDPGGIEEDTDVEKILSSGIYLIKPNEHETKMLTGITVSDFESAKEASSSLLKKGIENVLITIGAQGAYLFSRDIEAHIPIPKIDMSESQDETGCGDQTMAAMCVFLQEGLEIQEAVKNAVLAGTHQFNRMGIKPITREDLIIE